jgi:hypothetical protein
MELNFHKINSFFFSQFIINNIHINVKPKLISFLKNPIIITLNRFNFSFSAFCQREEEVYLAPQNKSKLVAFAP